MPFDGETTTRSCQHQVYRRVSGEPTLIMLYVPRLISHFSPAYCPFYSFSFSLVRLCRRSGVLPSGLHLQPDSFTA